LRFNESIDVIHNGRKRNCPCPCSGGLWPSDFAISASYRDVVRAWQR